jgi:hypothetical protein
MATTNQIPSVSTFKINPNTNGGQDPMQYGGVLNTIVINGSNFASNCTITINDSNGDIFNNNNPIVPVVFAVNQLTAKFAAIKGAVVLPIAVAQRPHRGERPTSGMTVTVTVTVTNYPNGHPTGGTSPTQQIATV